MNGYHITYNSGAGVFAYCGETQPCFEQSGKPMMFGDRKEAREALKNFRAKYGINRRHYVANRYRIIAAESADYVRNVTEINRQEQTL